MCDFSTDSELPVFGDIVQATLAEYAPPDRLAEYLKEKKEKGVSNGKSAE